MKTSSPLPTVIATKEFKVYVKPTSNSVTIYQLKAESNSNTITITDKETVHRDHWYCLSAGFAQSCGEQASAYMFFCGLEYEKLNEYKLLKDQFEKEFKQEVASGKFKLNINEYMGGITCPTINSNSKESFTKDELQRIFKFFEHCFITDAELNLKLRKFLETKLLEELSPAGNRIANFYDQNLVVHLTCDGEEASDLLSKKLKFILGDSHITVKKTDSDDKHSDEKQHKDRYIFKIIGDSIATFIYKIQFFFAYGRIIPSHPKVEEGNRPKSQPLREFGRGSAPDIRTLGQDEKNKQVFLNELKIERNRMHESNYGYQKDKHDKMTYLTILEDAIHQKTDKSLQEIIQEWKQTEGGRYYKKLGEHRSSGLRYFFSYGAPKSQQLIDRYCPSDAKIEKRTLLLR